MILYKYRAISDLTLSIFRDRKVWLSTAEALNDPFECTIQEIAKEYINEKYLKHMEAHLFGFIIGAKRCLDAGIPFWSIPADRVQEFIDIFKEIPSDQKYEFFRLFTKDHTGAYPTDIRDTFSDFDMQLQNIGIFSLASSSENQLMWAHYGEEFRGIAIGFGAEPASKLADPKHCIPVNYQDSLPAFNSDGYIAELSISLSENGMPRSAHKISFEDETFKLAVSTKPTCWEYEKEYRYIEESSGLYPLPGPIAELVFGLNCSKDSQNLVFQCVEESGLTGIEFFKLRKVLNTNSIQRERLEIFV